MFLKVFVSIIELIVTVLILHVIYSEPITISTATESESFYTNFINSPGSYSLVNRN